jgi:hypothetical protein
MVRSRSTIGKRNKQRGSELERESVDLAKEYETLVAFRSWGSDGRSMGLSEEVDVVLHKIPPDRYAQLVTPNERDANRIATSTVFIQCKRRKALAGYVRPSPGYIQVLRDDRKEPLAVLPLADLYSLLATHPNPGQFPLFAREDNR